MAINEASQNFLFLAIVAVVAVVAIVSLVLSGASLEGAQVTVSEEERVSRCQDTDPNNDHFTPGYAQLGKIRYDDFCDENGKLRQFYCEHGENVKPTRAFQCENGCLNGACLS